MKDRIAQLIKALGISARQFSLSIGKSEAFARTIKNSIGADVIGKILRVYPQVNAYWLILGDGDMMLSDDDKKISVEIKPDSQEFRASPETIQADTPLIDIIQKQMQEIKQLSEEVGRLKSDLDKALQGSGYIQNIGHHIPITEDEVNEKQE